MLADDPMEFYVVPSPIMAQIRSKFEGVPLAKIAECSGQWPDAEHG